MSVNRVALLGNVGKDPEVRDVSGAKVASFTLATSEKYTDRNGNKHENTEWHNVVLWRNLAELAESYVRKGNRLYVEGKLHTRSWESNGEKKYVTEIVGDKVELLERRDGAGEKAVQESDLPDDLL